MVFSGVVSCPEIITDVRTSTPEQCGLPTDHHILAFTVLLTFKRSKPVRRYTYDLCSLLSHTPLEIAFSGDIDLET